MLVRAVPYSFPSYPDCSAPASLTARCLPQRTHRWGVPTVFPTDLLESMPFAVSLTATPDPLEIAVFGTLHHRYRYFQGSIRHI